MDDSVSPVDSEIGQRSLQRLIFSTQAVAHQLVGKRGQLDADAAAFRVEHYRRGRPQQRNGLHATDVFQQKASPRPARQNRKNIVAPGGEECVDGGLPRLGRSRELRHIVGGLELAVVFNLGKFALRSIAAKPSTAWCRRWRRR